MKTIRKKDHFQPENIVKMHPNVGKLNANLSPLQHHRTKHVYLDFCGAAEELTHKDLVQKQETA